MLNRHHVENVQITMAESFGVKGRGKFYDETGVIRDVIQNHLLQIVSYLAMEAPSSTYAEAIRDEQAKVLRTIRPLSVEHMVRGQFKGYRNEPDVAANSKVETFAALRAVLFGSDSDPWPHQPDLNAERAGILLEVMRDLLYQTFVRKARLVQAVTFRRFVAAPQAEAG